MPKGKKYFKLVDYLLSEKRVELDEDLQSETGAIITHYLQSDTGLSPYADDHVRDKLKDSLYGFAAGPRTISRNAPLPLSTLTFDGIPFPHRETLSSLLLTCLLNRRISYCLAECGWQVCF